MKNIFLSFILSIFFLACQQQSTKLNNYPPSEPTQTLPEVEADILEQPDPILDAEKKATPHGRKILETGRQMTLVDEEIITGGCWDYADEVYNRSGYTSKKRKIIFKSNKNKGPYADISLIQPGDWLYYVNHWYGGIEHSAIFIDWVDYDNKEGLMLSYGGEKRQEPARYTSYDLTNVYYIVRPKY